MNIMCTNEDDLSFYTYGGPPNGTTTVQVLVEVSGRFLGIRGSFGQLAFLRMLYYLETLAVPPRLDEYYVYQ